MTSHEKYLLKLNDKNIKVRPLNRIKNFSDKILQKCECGNIWEISATAVLRGRRCGCLRSKPRKSHELYLENLHKRSISIIPQEEYRGSTEKINHKCYCGNIWNVSPNNIYAGNTCGCTKEANNILRHKNKKTILYYLKINNLYKVGITLYRKNIKNSIYKRFITDIKHNKIKVEILKIEIFDDGSEAYLKEQDILKKFKEYKYLEEDMKWFSGHTELFSEDIYK